MPSRVWEWPAWPEFTSEGLKENRDPDFRSTKRAVIERYGADALRQSWLQVCKDLEHVTEEISNKGNSIIPIFETEKVLASGGFTECQRQEVKRIGAFVFKGVVPERETTKLYQELKGYIADNKDAVKGWPAESPSMLILYDSPTQNTLRAHPNQLRLQRLLNGLWHDKTGQTTSDPLVYHDGVRDRAPGQPFLGLGPHIDAGSLCRWADEGYLKAYDKIFAGKVHEHDCYDLAVRHLANQELFSGVAHSSVFRSFQGWTALTATAPREGTIMVYPNVASVIAYVLLRPFFIPPPDPDDVLDAEKWTLDEETGFFPGTTKPNSQRLSRSSHPHLKLEKCLVHMPSIQPGDSVWWHSDLCHAVDTEHLGSNNASVAYIAACPSTPANKAYVKRQLEATLAGKPSPDYSAGNDLDETKLKGYVGLDHLTVEAKRAFGFDLLGRA
ncbi:uncharacterized protein F5Z01DRAFT_690670 [Emericellopsis atlantica]|uniref:DUF1479-domain-containing protein n=1 Tax=Emericellopsis atlantica TaxID=2614577 RepID=A0A9P8CMW2_9HYPO|nr:uncharacterized protein F5Z01DRAFT_690670 [Emericellopsis atlantica]KAG9252435.1 hypothetical protein F5Z01DRAFT_690670 [Emericellopsis atlantica]